jgi:membrane-associated PAP2 superfamily phosphatase
MEPVARPLPWVLAGLAATAALTALFWATNLDLRWQALAYSPSAPHWPYSRLLGFVILYHLGTLPGLILGVLAAVGLGLSFVRPEFVRWRYPCLFFVVLLALGPGLVINVLAKGFGGRPRPDQIVQFGGFLAFRHPFQPGFPQRGFSFLCGHCSMGYMFVGFFFLLRGWKRWATLAAGLAFGLLQGVGRVVQGAHFPSDALLGASVMFTLAAALSPVAGWLPKTGIERRHRLRVLGATALLVVLMVGFFLFSIGLRQESTNVWLEPGSSPPGGGASVAWWRPTRGAPPPGEVEIATEVGNITLEFRAHGEPLRIRATVTGYAFPGSSSDVSVGELPNRAGIFYRQRLSGLFIERHGAFLVRLREDVAASLRISTGQGDLVLAHPLPSRPLLLSGAFAISDPAGILKAAGPGRYVSAGTGAPIVLAVKVDRVLVER